jgi:hypothetical protein
MQSQGVKQQALRMLRYCHYTICHFALGPWHKSRDSSYLNKHGIRGCLLSAGCRVAAAQAALSLLLQGAGTHNNLWSCRVAWCTPKPTFVELPLQLQGMPEESPQEVIHT